MKVEDPEIQAIVEQLSKLTNEAAIDSAVVFISYRDPEQNMATKGMRLEFGNAFAAQRMAEDYLLDIEANKNASAQVQQAQALAAQQMRERGIIPTHTRNGHPRG